MSTKETTSPPANGARSELAGLILLCLAALVFLSTYSFDRADVAFNGTEVNDSTSNLVGILGAWTAQGLFFLFGASGYLVGPLMLLFGLFCFIDRWKGLLRRWPWAVVVVLCISAGLSLFPNWASSLKDQLNAPDAGGAAGWFLNWLIFRHLGTAGAVIILMTLYLVSLLFLTNFNLTLWLRDRWQQWREKKTPAEIVSRQEAALQSQAEDLAKQVVQLQKQIQQKGGKSVETVEVPAALSGIGADMQPVPEPTIRDLSVPIAANSRQAKTEPESTRRLAAIVFTDIAGYTRLSSRDEKAALKLLKKQRSLLRPIVKEFQGEWLKEIGDGLLLSFNSSLGAVQCALRMQEAARSVAHLNLRVGIHQGDIVCEGGDILGDGVNIASRIEPYAPVGGIAISGKIQQDIASHPEYQTRLLGEFDLQGVDQRVEIFAVTDQSQELMDETRLVEPPLAEPAELEIPRAATTAEVLGTEVVVAGTEPVIRTMGQRPKARKRPMSVATVPQIGDYKLPPLSLLQEPDTTQRSTDTKETLMANARLMQQTLAQFEIEVAVGDITKGPTITRYELHPAPGVKLEKITSLSKNIAAAVRAERISILAPIPGKSSVGIEVPNLVKTKVIMRDLLESEEMMNTKARIPVALGKDVYGNPIIADLGDMPHLLIAGATGAGKSVCINSIIASLLYRFSPDQLRFVMIDPKVVELQMYNALPHLVVPVVTDAKKVILALRWVVQEMEKRYRIFARVNVKNIKSFNDRPHKPKVVAEPELPLISRDNRIEPKSDGFAVEVDEEIAAVQQEDIIIPEKLSYIVVVIDELADLMLVAPADVEMAIARITQMARAAGIHCIVATQRPSVDVITGVIKANIPARIAFQVAQRVDSRTILDEMGAEKLLGKGDMLYLPPGSAKPTRVQGVLVTDQEIQSVIDYIAVQGKPSYEMDIHQQLSKPTSSFGDNGGCDEDEALIESCIEVIRTEQKASVSLLQRRLRLGYTRAARIMDEIENRGIVGPSKGAEPRDILIDLDALAAEQLATK